AVNDAAARIGVRAGLTVAQAQAVAPEVIVRARSPELEKSARAALEDLAASFSPRIEPGSTDRRDGEISLDVADLGKLFDREEQIATAIWMAARKLGFHAQVGLA